MGVDDESDPLLLFCITQKSVSFQVIPPFKKLFCMLSRKIFNLEGRNLLAPQSTWNVNHRKINPVILSNSKLTLSFLTHTRASTKITREVDEVSLVPLIYVSRIKDQPLGWRSFTTP